MPSIVAGEILYGLEGVQGRRRQLLANFLNDLVNTHSVLTVGFTTAQHYGLIKHQLRTAGTPIPENDIWIAASAMEHDLTLVTRDAHFGHVAGLKCVRW